MMFRLHRTCDLEALVEKLAEYAAPHEDYDLRSRSNRESRIRYDGGPTRLWYGGGAVQLFFANGAYTREYALRAPCAEAYAALIQGDAV